MKYFGTDGIRGIVGKTLTKNTIHNLARAIVLYYKNHKLKKVLLIGNDSRESSCYILSELGSVLLRNGIEIHNLDECSSPCLAYITQKFNYPLSLMISASHNPSEFNGLKFFNSNGEKVDDNFEKTIEFFMDRKLKFSNNKYTKIHDVQILKNSYISYLKQIVKVKIPCIIDCANGGSSSISKIVFSKQKLINCRPNGTNINYNSGCTSIENLKSICIKNNQIGFAFDGDADRVFAISESGKILNGDSIIYILSNFYAIHESTVVGTIYTNLTLEQHLKNKNISLLRADVGDKNVYNEMNLAAASIGGEESGHIILKPFANTGDGVLIALILIKILQSTKKSLDELIKDYHPSIQLRENIKITNNHDVLDYTKLVNKYSTPDCRIIIRPSGTEPVLRLFVESNNELQAKNILQLLKNEILMQFQE